jgi:acetyl esterase/lipase
MKPLFYLALGTLLVAGCGSGQQGSVQPATEQPATRRAEETPKEEAETLPERKNIVALTPRAAAEVRKLAEDVKGTWYLRARISTTDLKYKLDIETYINSKLDYLGESEGIPIVVDRRSVLLFPAGITVDYADEDGRRGFIISSPTPKTEPVDTSVSLVEARRGFKTTLARRESGGNPPPAPPPNLLDLVHYDAPPGRLAGYLSPDPKDDKKHPAIIWITGGDCNSIDEGCWHEGPASNDQSASAYRKAGILMMFPALRGGNDNPGIKEGFLGEVDDVLAAAAFLRKQAFIDPDRIYLGGHSTGGTLALLTAECTDQFRAVFSFGPVDDVRGYSPRYNPFVLSDLKEVQLRSPGRWLHSIAAPVFVFEGTGGNRSSLQAMSRSSTNPKVRFFEVKGTDHFGVLAPTNRLIADKILRDSGPTCSLVFTQEELNKPFVK